MGKFLKSLVNKSKSLADWRKRFWCIYKYKNKLVRKNYSSSGKDSDFEYKFQVKCEKAKTKNLLFLYFFYFELVFLYFNHNMLCGFLSKENIYFAWWKEILLTQKMPYIEQNSIFK